MGKYQTGKHLEAFVLLFLAGHSGHGGAVLQWLREILPGDWVIDGGRVYRLLRELDEAEAVTSHWSTESGAAPVRIYTITALGRGRLELWHQEISVRHDSLQRFLDGYEAWRRDPPTPRDDEAFLS